jgi:aminopeptidase N
MKKILFFLLIGAFQHALGQGPDPDFIEKMAVSEIRNFQKSAGFTEAAGYADYDLTRQRLNFTVDPAINYIGGSVFSSFRFLNDDVRQIRFDLTTGMIVDQVKYNQLNVTFEHAANIITITLPAPSKKNTFGSVEIFYHGTPPPTGMGSFTASRHNNAPVIYTLSEPYGARDWWPCKESLKDKIDSLDVFISCPSQYKAASNGKLVSDQVSGNSRTAHWQHRYPIATYLVAIAVTNYETYSDFLDLPDGGKIEILNYIYPEYLTTAKSKRAEALDIMSFYNKKFITYPFASEKYGHAQFGWGGGMEHQTMSFMTTLDYELVAHEMAHQWFGDYITLASWHDIWLNEGFATYLTGLVFENLQNGVWWSNWKSNVLSGIVSSAGGTVYVADTTDINRIFNGRLSYSKGAYLLHMLRWEMGDELFFKGMKNYLTDPAIANGFASQEKFVKHMETVADTSFTEFFKDWYYGEGYPIFRLTYFPDPANPQKQKLRISQTQSHPSVSFFEVTVPVRIWKNGRFTDLRLKLTKQNQEFTISDQPFDKLEFDPDQWLIAKADRVVPAQTIGAANEIQIIPDVTSKRIRVILPDFKGNETLRIFDLGGKILLDRALRSADSWTEIQSLRKGFYLAEVHAGLQSKSVKIVVN